MEVECNKVQDQLIIFRIMLHLVSKDNKKVFREQKIKGKNFMSENKRILNLHEQKFVELVVFQANTTMFLANTNASLKNLETQVGQLVLTM